MTEKRFKLDDFDSEVEMWELLNIQAEVITDLEKENGQLKKEVDMLSCELSVSANKTISKDCRIQELVKENEELKKALIELKEIGDYQEMRIKEFDDENQSLKFQLDECQNHKLFSRRELEKENEQLKERNNRLEEKIQRERTSFIKTHERWSKEAETKIKELSEKNEQLQEINNTCRNARDVYSKKILELEKENEQLKKELKAFREERHKEFIIGNGW